MRRVLFALACLAVAPLGALEPAVRQEAPALRFLAPGDLARARELPPFPAEGSLEAQADLEAVLQAQAWRGAREEAWARAVDRQTVFLFAEVLGQGFRPGALPALERLLEAVEADRKAFSRAAKAARPRLRPPYVDARVKPCVEIPVRGSSSYPSGHSLEAFTWAAVLAELWPERRDALQERAHRMAWGRVIGGVHFPSDLVGGRLLAARLAEALRRSAAYRDALEACRREAAGLDLRRAG